VIHAPAMGSGGAARLIETLRASGVGIEETPQPVLGEPSTLVLTTPVNWMKLGVWMAPWRVARGARLVVLSRIGAHPDARAQELRDLWQLEEYARVSAIPALTLRFAPLVAGESPFWTRLRSRPRLREEGRTVVMPVLEEDALAVLERALGEARPSEDWYEIVGPEARSIDEWIELAVARGGAAAEGAGAWEPPLEELTEHRLCEPQIWQERFGMAAHSVTRWANAS